MISYEANVICDACGANVIGSSMPRFEVEYAVRDAEARAIKFKWAHDGETWTCPKCMEQLKQSVKYNPPKRII